MSFCRITGKARGLPKPNYFPLLPPISPADAKRCCRITTKSQGLPGHHFIPALLGAKNGNRGHCRVTAKSEGQGPHHFPDIEGAVKPHEILPGYKYVFPSFDEEQKQHKHLLTLMSGKVPPGESNAKYVYTVEEKLTGLVIPAELEAAVRDGDVQDVMLDKEGDTMLVKMHHGPNVTIDVTNLEVEEGMLLWDGLGPSESVLQQRLLEEQKAEMSKKKRQEGLSNRKKIFEEKERVAEKEEIEITKRKEVKKSNMVKVKMRGGNEEEIQVSGAILAEATVTNEERDTPIFGHIVQTAAGVEFFPGKVPMKLPEGKAVPGRLIRTSEGVKFVPGIISEERFIPGQLVSTNKGEQFVPGQVVETSEGPKFVPGQVAETSSGPKFVPGQTIETEDGPQFVPGQIIETKAGPTFIPGQIIVTDDTARFVPGRVVDTAEGPRFVPGRVIESGNQVTFVSGQIVETPEGLKFVAPDLEDAPEGGHEFSVQGFEVTPEELKLLRPAMICNPTSCGNMAIDSKMLRQLSEAGMSVGRQVPAELPAVDIRPLPVVVERLKLEGANVIKMGQIITSLAQVALKISERQDLCASQVNVDENTGSGLIHAIEKNKDPGKYLKAIVASAVLSVKEDPMANEETTLSAVGSAIESALGELAENIPMDGVVENLHMYLTKPHNLSHLIVEAVHHLEANETAIDRLKFAISGNVEPGQATEKLASVLKDNMGEAFLHLSSGDAGLLKNVLERIDNLDEIKSDHQAIEMLQKAIVGAVRERGEERLRNMLENSCSSSEGKDFKDLLLQSIGLARALGMTQVASVLLDVVSDSKSLEVLSSDPTTIDVLERLTIMRQFAETKPEFSSALKQLVSDPELAKSDPGVRELVRHSTALMVVPEEPLQTSYDIPTSLLLPHNALAMEEFLAKTRRPRTLLILKSGLQAVVPREASRAVITGQVPYAVLDEKGIKYFEPLHVFSTMKLPQYAAHCFSMYCCPEVEYESGLVTPADSTPRGSISSSEDFGTKKRSDWNRSTYTNGRYPNGNFSSRRATLNLEHSVPKHILDRRLSDWANGALFISNGNNASNDSLLLEPNNGTDEFGRKNSSFFGSGVSARTKQSTIY